MTGNSDPANFNWRFALAALSLVAGIGLILLSVFWPSGSVSHANWSPEQAKQYQQASLKLHSLSHAPNTQTETAQQAYHRDLKQAESDYQAIRAKLDSAIDGSSTFLRTLRWGGAVLAAIGGFGLYRFQSPEDDNHRH
jgi:hypothetical protein